MSRSPSWLPDMARRRPSRRISISYRVPGAGPPNDVGGRLAEALHSSKLNAAREGAWSWRVDMPWQTRVFGIIPREVDEQIRIQMIQRPDQWSLEISLRPVETHSAHAAGLAGVLVIAAAVWFAAGFAPALAAILAGALVVEVTRQWAFDALERTLRRLAGDLGSALWPGRPAQIAVNR